MKIVKVSVDRDIEYTEQVVACIGYFDGMHAGHQALIRKTTQLAEKTHALPGMITFEPDPWVTIKGISSDEVQHITKIDQRIRLAEKYGIQVMFILDFTKKMASLEPNKFVENILGKINLKGIVCGFDFHYGSRGAGNYHTLAESTDFPVCVVEAVSDQGGKISSTRISELLTHGDIEEANKLLGSNFTMEGTVIHGRHIGEGLGFPTVNIAYSNEYLKPKEGVYIGYGIVDGKAYKAMINLGHNPTVNYIESESLEAFLLDFNQNIYGKNIEIEFVRYLRPEIKFESREKLIEQLEQDMYAARESLSAR